MQAHHEKSQGYWTVGALGELTRLIEKVPGKSTCSASTAGVILAWVGRYRWNRT